MKLYSESFEMKQKVKLKVGTYEKALEYQRIGNRAVRQAQEENHRLGLPNIYSRNGKIIYEMPDGKLIVKDSAEIENEKSSAKLLEMARNARKEISEGKSEPMDFEKL